MSDSAKYKNSTRLIQLALISGTLIASSAWGFETNYDRGRVDFAGRVTDISCSRGQFGYRKLLYVKVNFCSAHHQWCACASAP